MISRITEEAFKNATGVSYSRLSNLAQSPQAYQKGLVDDPESSAISIGTASDIKLTQPDRFDEEIYVMSTPKPGSEAMQTFCEVYAMTGDFAQAYIASGYKINEKRVQDKFDTEGKDYHDALLAGHGKNIIDVEDLFKVNNIVNAVQSNPYTKKYFVNETEGVELMFQLPILWKVTYQSLMDNEIKEVSAKSLLDVVRIDHNKKIVQPIEFKTGAEGFYKSYRRWNRLLQGSMYYDAIAQHISMSGDHKEYVVEPLRFIYADTNLVYPPTVFKMSQDEIRVGREGRKYTAIFDENGNSVDAERFLSQYKIKGYRRLIAELEWHDKNNMWDYSYDVYTNEGEVDLDTVSIKF